MKALNVNLLMAVCYVILALIVYVVAVGGIVCLKDADYEFAEYLTDLTGIYKLMATAVVSAIAHAYFARNGGSA